MTSEVEIDIRLCKLGQDNSNHSLGYKVISIEDIDDDLSSVYAEISYGGEPRWYSPIKRYSKSKKLYYYMPNLLYSSHYWDPFSFSYRQHDRIKMIQLGLADRCLGPDTLIKYVDTEHGILFKLGRDLNKYQCKYTLLIYHDDRLKVLGNDKMLHDINDYHSADIMAFDSCDDVREWARGGYRWLPFECGYGGTIYYSDWHYSVGQLVYEKSAYDGKLTLLPYDHKYTK